MRTIVTQIKSGNMQTCTSHIQIFETMTKTKEHFNAFKKVIFKQIKRAFCHQVLIKQSSTLQQVKRIAAAAFYRQ